MKTGIFKRGRYHKLVVHGYAVCIDHRTREIKFRDPYPIWAKALVAAYLAEEGFLRGE